MTPQEFTSLISQHNDYVSGFIFNLTKNHMDKDDIISESVLFAWKHRHKTSYSQFRSWWSSIAKNCLLTLYRDRQRHSKDRREGRTYTYINKFEHDILPESEDIKKLNIVLECLPPRQREVFLLYKGNEHSSYKNPQYSSSIANEYSIAAIKNIKAIWKIFDISPDIKKIHLLSPAKVGKILGVCDETVLKLIKQGKIKAFKIGNKYQIDESWADDYLTKQKSGV